ncbi:site-specific integrase [Roseiconus lacunae]|uniref:tyrosine-type recombinase/integrase n=1 Tax=Roseiconus lacunae TaxID=2605694 RepID=UPI00308A8BD1|nr:site-specific integrase [Stieleria sp. HD01]
MSGQSLRAKSDLRKRLSKPKKFAGSPLTPHASGQYCARVDGKIRYFGRDHDDALRRYELAVAGVEEPKPQPVKAKGKTKKPPKVPGSPLTPHASGSYCARVGGKVRYFGPDHDDALRRYFDARAGFAEDDKRASVADVCDAFMDAKQAAVDAGALSPRTRDDYHAMVKRFARYVGRDRKYETLQPKDFAGLRASYKWQGSSTVNREVGMVKTLVRWAELSGYARLNPGPDFVGVPKRAQRLERKAKGPLIFTAKECWTILREASPQVRAMILLSINAGFGPTDCSELKQSDIDFDRSWISLIRHKTGEDRDCYLWPETAAALKVAIEQRPEPKDADDADLVFVTKYGQRWVREGSRNSPLSQAITKITKKLGIHRNGHSFYSFRRTFRTVADGAGDTVAARRIMGHVASANDMCAVYVQSIEPERIRRVCDHVRQWLLAGRYLTVRLELPRCERWGGCKK